MYTNIDTSHALHLISEFLKRPTTWIPPEIHPDSLVKALHLLMRHNVFRFGDTYWLQMSGTAMGTPPAPMYATLYFAILELDHLPKEPNLFFYRRYIDDGIGIWLPSNVNSWTHFRDSFNSLCSLEWEFSPLHTQVDFLDMTIHISSTGQLSTRLFEKAMNLYLYLPSHSAHPPGVLKGLIHGMIQRIYRLSSTLDIAKQDIRHFQRRLLARGYSPFVIDHLIRLADLDHSVRFRPTTVTPKQSASLFLHLPFHPSDPASSTIQRTFRQTLLAPRTPSLPHLRNLSGHRFGCGRLIVAYHRPRNIGNLLSPRKLLVSTGTVVPVLSCQDETNDGATLASTSPPYQHGR